MRMEKDVIVMEHYQNYKYCDKHLNICDCVQFITTCIMMLFVCEIRKISLKGGMHTAQN